MFFAGTNRGRIAGLLLAIAAVVSAVPAALADPTLLFTPGNTFTSNSHIVSTTVFSWYSSTGGQVDGPWRPMEGRLAWTGAPAFWETQVKQMMAANIDVLQVEMFSDYSNWYDQRRTNLFQALSNLRSQGYNVPKVCPFLDTAISTSIGWTSGTGGQPVNLSTTAGKNNFVNQFTRFYNQYYGVNTEAYADSYIHQIDGRVVLDSYVLFPEYVTNVNSLTREHVQSRLVNAFGGQHALFKDLPSNGIFMIDIVAGDHFSFEDERLVQFEYAGSHYISSTSQNGRLAAHVMPGYWDANIRNPEGGFLARNGGVGYRNAWLCAQAEKRNYDLKHVNVESWNEYDEGSGIYAANPGTPYIKPGSGNTHSDTWSSTYDPYEYIKTTAEGARLFNDAPDLGSTVIWHNLPTTMRQGETRTVQVTVRNEGDVSWKGATGFKLGENQAKDPAMFSSGQFLIDDASNEIPMYGGVFRGRPLTFNVQITAPMSNGTYLTHWQMKQEGIGWFGQELSQSITVIPEPSTAAILATGALAFIIAVALRRLRR